MADDNVDPAKVKEVYEERGLDWMSIKTCGVDR